jgi:hypothetical protein
MVIKREGNSMMDVEERRESMNNLETEFNGLMNCADREVSAGSRDIALGYYRAALVLAECGIRGDSDVVRGVRWAIGVAGSKAAIDVLSKMEGGK